MGAASWRRGRAVAAAAALIAVSLLSWSGRTPARPERGGNGSARATSPTIVLILTDDQRWDSLWAMPNIRSLLAAHGIDFSSAFVVNSLCCPSRASLLTGNYSHSTKVYNNAGPYGGFASFHDDDTVAIWLHDGGYRTALIGKYLNGYDSTYIPPGWDRWVAFKGAEAGAAYYDYDLNVDGTVVSYGHDEADYSTDVLAAFADSFIRETDLAQPLFLYLAFKAPHVPSTPAIEYMGAFDDLPPYRPPNYNEADVSDKPAWVQALPRLSLGRQHGIDINLQHDYETLLSVDDVVGAVVTALGDTGRISNTMIVFTSDNGWARGEHRWGNKQVAYEESIRVPLVIRYDPFTWKPRTDQHLVTNIDLAATFAEVAQVKASTTDGMSMMPLIRSPDPGQWRSDFLIEHLRQGPSDVPTYCAVRNEGYTYVRYLTTGEEELYDLAADRWELLNVATDPDYADTLASLREREATLCDPPPPLP